MEKIRAKRANSLVPVRDEEEVDRKEEESVVNLT